MATAEKATFSIEFVVVGGSIAGLASGYCLRKAGHTVHIVEKSEGNAKKLGSIRSPPNMTRILQGWPDAKDLFSKATKCSGYHLSPLSRVYRLKVHVPKACPSTTDSERMGYMKFHDEIMTQLGADFLIFQLCLDVGVLITYGREVVGVSNADGPTTVIGADGHNSLLRGILGDEEESGTVQGQSITGINISVPTKVFREHEDLKSLCTDKEVGPSVLLQATSLKTILTDVNLDGKRVKLRWHFECMRHTRSLSGTESGQLDAETTYFTLCAPTRLYVDVTECCTNSPESKALPFDLSHYDPRLQKLISLGSGSFPTLQNTFELEECVGLDDTTILLGDAAHCAPIEDAATIGGLFAHLSGRSQVRRLLNAYQEIRRPRTTATQTSELSSLGHICLPPGDLKVARDTVYQATLHPDFAEFNKCADSPVAAEAWEAFLVMFSHNASEEASASLVVTLEAWVLINPAIITTTILDYMPALLVSNGIKLLYNAERILEDCFETSSLQQEATGLAQDSVFRSG
ncbi:hypothetical protein C8R47DRAFT_1073958 [Mycena vitilis]|nr:hypothetical protein C8R47DRAFT_1073958 [Mycena vitilis]